MAKPAHLEAPIEAPTVRDVARISGYSERTVWYDIARRRLPAIRSPGRPTRVPWSALETYRSVPYAADGVDLLTVLEASEELGKSVRTVRRGIRKGTIAAVRFSARSLRICAAQTQAIAELREERRDNHRAHELERRRRSRLIARGVRFLMRQLDEPVRIDGYSWMDVPSVARLCGKSKPEVYRHVLKAALPVSPDPFGRRRRWIHWKDVYEYADSHDVRTAIIAWLASRLSIPLRSSIVLLRSAGLSSMAHRRRFFADIDDDARLEIVRSFVAWLTANPARLRSAKR